MLNIGIDHQLFLLVRIQISTNTLDIQYSRRSEIKIRPSKLTITTAIGVGFTG